MTDRLSEAVSVTQTQAQSTIPQVVMSIDVENGDVGVAEGVASAPMTDSMMGPGTGLDTEAGLELLTMDDNL